jgi:iron complex transport system ATP-binding protein
MSRGHLDRHLDPQEARLGPDGRDGRRRHDASAVAELRAVGVRRSGTAILSDVSLTIGRRDHLAVLGPNGAGKTTLLRVLSTYLYPTEGAVTVLGTTFGRGDLRELRHRIGFVSVGLDPLVHERADALPLVAVARRGGLWPPPGILYDRDLREAAEHALLRVGASHLAGRRVDTLSQGERQRVRIARALATDRAASGCDDHGFRHGGPPRTRWWSPSGRLPVARGGSARR